MFRPRFAKSWSGRNRHSPECEVHQRLAKPATRLWSRVRTCDGVAAGDSRFACAAGGRAGVRIPTIWAWKKPASKRIRAATSSWTINCAPTCRASGRWAIATARAGSRILPITISRSWRQIFWITIRGASATAFRLMRCIIDPPLGRAGMTEAEVLKSGPQGADRQAAHDQSRARRGEGRDAGLHEDPGGRGDAARSWARRCSGPAAMRRSIAFWT